MRSPRFVCLSTALAMVTAAAAAGPYSWPQAFEFPGFSGLIYADFSFSPEFGDRGWKTVSAAPAQIPTAGDPYFFIVDSQDAMLSTAGALMSREVYLVAQFWGDGMYYRGTATTEDGSPLPDGTLLGRLEFQGATQESRDLVYKSEWGSRGHVFEVEGWPDSTDLWKRYNLAFDANFTGVVNITAFGVKATITADVPQDSGPLNVTQTVNFPTDGVVKNDSMFTFMGDWSPLTVTAQDTGARVREFQYLLGLNTSTLEIAVPANTSAIRLNGMTGYNPKVMLRSLTSSDSWQQSTLMTRANARGSNGTIAFAPLDPAQLWVVRLNSDANPWPEQNGMALTSVDLWSYYTAGNGTGTGENGIDNGHSAPPAKRKSNVGAIAGGVVGGVLGLLLLVMGLLFCRSRRKHRKTKAELELAKVNTSQYSEDYHNAPTPFISGPRTQSTEWSSLSDSTPRPRSLGTTFLTSPTTQSGTDSASKSFAVASSSAGLSDPTRPMTPPTPIEIEEDAGALRPVRTPAAIVLPPRYDPQWAHEQANDGSLDEDRAS